MCDRRTLRFFYIETFMLLSVMFAAPVFAEQPWDGAPFGAKPSDIATAARQQSGKEPGVLVLLDETRIELDSDGRLTSTHREVYRIGTQSPGNWSVVAALWQPWHEQRPAIRARVISSDGRETILDQATISESPATALGLNTFGDGRILRAPLPALAPGAVVERQTVVQDSKPLFERGIVRTVTFGNLNAVQRTVLTIDAPATLPLQYQVRYLPDVKPVNATNNSRKLVTFESGPIDALDPLKVAPFAGESRVPRVIFSTSASWKDVAESYGNSVNSIIRNADVLAAAKEAMGGATTRDQIIENILQKVQRSIRYEAVQLGDASIIPTPPAETLKLEYGDCKDQAALLVSMFRAVGVEAYLALLRAGPNADVEEGLPGFGEFDHAIVYVPGENPLWIDSTTRFSRAGQLPPGDQGRLALIIKPDSTALQRTPLLNSHIIETLKVTLNESPGAGQLDVDKEFHGTEELITRASNSEIEKSDAEKIFSSVAEAIFDADGIKDLERSASADFSAPFRIHFGVVSPDVAQTKDSIAQFTISPAVMVAESGLALVAGLDDKMIGNGLDLQDQLIQDWKVRIVPPPGYQKSEFSKDQTWNFGPATMTSKFTEEPDGSVTGSIHFDIGKRIYSGADLANAKKALDALDNAPPISFSFQMTAKVALDEGRIADALMEIRKMIALHPNEAVHHDTLAYALVTNGMGDEARTEAKRAVELEPQSSKAYSVLGTTYQFDLIGRWMRKGLDRDQAEAAYKKALELSPDDFSVHSNYASLLEMNKYGVRGDGSDYAGAVEQFKALEARLGDDSPIRSSLYNDLLMLKRFDEIKMAGAKAPPVYRIAAIAVTDGVTSALREAGKLETSKRANTLNSAINALTQIRYYEVAAELAQSGAIPGVQSNGVALRRFEDVKLPEGNPISIAKQFIIESVSPKAQENLPKLLSSQGQSELKSKSDMVPRVATRIRNASSFSNSEASRVDSLIASDPKLKGDDKTGYQVSFDSFVFDGVLNIYVVKEAGQYKILTAGRNDVALARGALRFAEQNDLESAREWLDWVDDELSAQPASKYDFSTDAFDQTWLVALQKNRDRMRFAAAAALSSSQPDAAAILPVLVEGQQKTTGTVRAALALAYANALYTLGRREESARTALDLLKTNPKSSVIYLLTTVLVELGRLDELKTLLENNQKNAVDERSIVLILAGIDVRQGHSAEAESRVKKYFQAAKRTPDDESILAWFSLYHDHVTDADIAPIQASINQGPLSISLKTLAALKASSGKPGEALTIFKQYLESSRKEQPESDDWFILGRIYEGFGEREAAAAAYRKVEAPSSSQIRFDSSFALAQARLSHL